ncbi:MAG: DUF2066 domain-containing protein [Sedimenticola sp.]|nr:DUF2066 domain-containing protein [Sedimenticola sp.]
MPYYQRQLEMISIKPVCQLFLIMLLLGVVASASASQVSGLYSAEVPVEGQSSEQRTEGIMRAFTQMLVKVTGNRKIAQRPELQADLKLAPRYVQQYRYRLHAEPQPEGGESAADEAGRLLMVQFDEDAVQRLLRDRRLPVWGDNRPSGLIWLGFEGQGQRRLMRPESDAALLDIMIRQADQRGIPMMLPLMDLEDQAGMQVADLWGSFEQNIRRASERYSPDLIVTGKLNQLSGGLWRANWQLYHGDRSSSWRSESNSPATLVTEGVEHVSDLLAERYAPMAGESGLSRVRLRVSGVVALQHFAGLERFLHTQSSVEQAEILSAEPDSITYELRVRGGVQVLAQGLALGGLIEPVPDASDPSSQLVEGVDLYYRMR